jgi:hypothetical protein
MPDSVFTFRMPAGIPGECSRFNVIGTTIKPENQNSTTPFTLFGQVGTIDANGARPVLATDTAIPPVVGIAVRPFPTSDMTVALPGVVPFGPGVPAPRGVIDIMYRGYVTMKLNGATAAAKGGAVYVYYAASAGSHVQAGIEAASGANLWLLTGAYFSGPADAQGNVEIAFHI